MPTKEPNFYAVRMAWLKRYPLSYQTMAEELILIKRTKACNLPLLLSRIKTVRGKLELEKRLKEE
jgi:hypothetical protein